MNALIANLIRLFHAVFWLLLFIGILVGRSIRVSTICTFVVLLCVMLWDLLGYCFLNVLENGMDPLQFHNEAAVATGGSRAGGAQPVDDTSLVFKFLSEKTSIQPWVFTIAFNYVIYFVLFVGLFRSYTFLNPSRF